MNQKQLASLLGLSRATVSSDVHHGMPTGSAAEAAAWRRIHRAPRSSRGKANPVTANPDAKSEPTASPITGDDWPARIDRARQTERETHAAYIGALSRGETAQLERLLGAHGRSISALAEAERISLEARTASRELIPAATAREIMREITIPLRQAVEMLPVQERSNCNPDHPEIAQAALKTWGHRLLVRLSTMETKF